MAQKQQAGNGLSEAEAAVANAAVMFEIKFLKGGRWQKGLFRNFTEAQTAAALCGDERATITVVGDQGQKVAIARNDWPRWMNHFA